MKLYVSPMDSVVVDYDNDGKVQLEGEEFKTPSLQERRAIGLRRAQRACRADRTARRTGTDGPGFLTVRPFRYFVVTTLLYAALTAVMTYPQVLHLNDTVHDDGDPLLNAWAIAWVAHQLPIAPAHLFDANIFYPERRTLAFSETLLLPSLVVAPLRWIGFSVARLHVVPVRIHAVGVGRRSLLVRSLTGNGLAGCGGDYLCVPAYASITIAPNCSKPVSAVLRSGHSPTLQAHACETEYCSAGLRPARCCRACTTGCSWCRSWQWCAPRC
jgi:hypothetical protein